MIQNAGFKLKIACSHVWFSTMCEVHYLKMCGIFSGAHTAWENPFLEGSRGEKGDWHAMQTRQTEQAEGQP